METSKITQSLFIASLIGLIFNISRGDFFNATGLAYLMWNLFLAWIPFILSVYFIKPSNSIKRALPFFLAWLLFFPNAPYVVTDTIHVISHARHALWFDSLIFFFFGWISLLLGIISLAHIEIYLRAHFKIWISELSIFLICIITSFGIYLGRFDRFNSWDLFIHPRELLHHSYIISIQVGSNFTPFAFVAAFTVFIYTIYKTMSYVLVKKEKELVLERSAL
jgi:uncharacterized membrane protein